MRPLVNFAYNKLSGTTSILHTAQMLAMATRISTTAVHSVIYKKKMLGYTLEKYHHKQPVHIIKSLDIKLIALYEDNK